MFNRRALLLVLSLAIVAMTIAILVGVGTDELGVRMLIRTTARSSLTLFLLAFVASSAARLWPNALTQWLLRNRRYLGLSFALSHFIHLGAVGTLAMRWPHPFMEQSASALTLVGGGAGYLGLALMVATSWDGAVRALGGKRWRVLHLAGSWILWIIFAQSYAGRAVGAPWPYALVMFAIVGVVVVRVVAWRRRRIP